MSPNLDERDQQDTPSESPSDSQSMAPYLRSVCAILFLILLMLLVMVLPVNSTLKMGFSCCLLFMIVYTIACVVQANLAQVIMASSSRTLVSPHSRNNLSHPRIPSSPRHQSPHRLVSVNASSTPPSRTPSPNRQHHHRHHNNHHRHRHRSDPPPPYEHRDFSCTPEYLSADDPLLCHPPPYAAVVQIEQVKDPDTTPKD